MKIMKIKYVLITAAAFVTLGFAMHRGLTQVPPLGPTIVGPGVAPNVGTPVDPRSLSYYGGYYGAYNYDSNNAGMVSLYNVTFGPEDIPQTSSRLTTKFTSSSASFSWSGENRAIDSVTFALTDKNNAVISRQVITSVPVRATLKKTSKATGYSVTVQYINGLTNTVSSQLQ